jgi:hypothetical protein
VALRALGTGEFTKTAALGSVLPASLLLLIILVVEIWTIFRGQLSAAELVAWLQDPGF